MIQPAAIVTFHGIGTPPPGVPEAEIPYWISPEDFESTLGDLVSAARAAGIGLTATFDDGNRSDLEIAAPLLAAHGVAGLFFPCAARIGQAGYLDGADLRRLHGMGFGIGSHGMDHRPWATLSGAELTRETRAAKDRIEAALGSVVTTAALPFGSYNRRALAAARAAGFEKLYSSDPGFSRADAWFVRRFSYRAGRPFDLAAMIRQHGAWPQKVKAAVKHRIKALR